ncbi:MAG: helix-hairpin-helix domain-containing protein [Sarcina sp.]
MEENNILEAIVKKDRMMYPKGRSTNSEGDFAIITFEVIETIRGEAKIHKIYKTITCKGIMPRIDAGKEYMLIAKETFDEKYKSYSYDVSYIGSKSVEISNEEDLKDLITHISTERQAESIMKIPNVLEVFKSGDINKLQEINGIGEKTSKLLISKFKETSSYGSYIAKMARWGITKNMMSKLLEKFHNYKLIYEKIQHNPYILTRFEGIGFKRADEIALEIGIEPNSPFRIEAYIVNLLNEKALEGKSFVLTREALDKLHAETDSNYPIARETISKTFEQMKLNKKLWWNENKSVLANNNIRNTELKIAENIMRLLDEKPEDNIDDWEEVVARMERSKGYSFTDQQKEGIEKILRNNVVVVTGLAGTRQE